MVPPGARVELTRRCSLSLGSTMSKSAFPGEDAQCPPLRKLKRANSQDRTQPVIPNTTLFSGAESLQKSKQSQGTGLGGRRATMAVPLCTSASLRWALGNTAKILIARHRSGTPSV